MLDMTVVDKTGNPDVAVYDVVCIESWVGSRLKPFTGVHHHEVKDHSGYFLFSFQEDEIPPLIAHVLNLAKLRYSIAVADHSHFETAEQLF